MTNKQARPSYNHWPQEKLDHKLKRGALGWSDEDLPHVSGPDTRALAERDPAEEVTELGHDVMKARRLAQGLSPYPPGSLGCWVEPEERQHITAADE